MLAMVACVLLFERLRAAVTIAPLDYNEGWNAYFADRLVRTGSPYPNAGELVTNNYPPLWFAIVALAGKATSSMIGAGRLVATIGFFLLVGSAAGIGRTLRGTWGAVAAAVTTAYVMLTQANDWVAVADPQILAQGVAALALFLAVRAASPSATAYQGAMAVAVLSGFLKHNLAAVPAALLLVALLDGRRAFLRSALAALGALVAGYLVCALIGGAAWPRQLVSPRTYAISRVVNATIPFLATNIYGVALAFTGIATLRSGHAKRLLIAYIALALPIAVFFSGGAGVAGNIFFDPMIAMAIAASLCVGTAFGVRDAHAGDPSELAAGFSARFAPWAPAAAVGLWVFAAGMFSIRDVVHRLNHAPLGASVAAYQEDIRFLRSIDGNVICGQPALCYLAGKPFIYDPYNAEQALVTGARTAADVREQLRQAGVQAIVTRPAPDNRWGIPAPMVEEVGTQFDVVRRSVMSEFHVRRAQ